MDFNEKIDKIMPFLKYTYIDYNLVNCNDTDFLSKMNAEIPEDVNPDDLDYKELDYHSFNQIPTNKAYDQNFYVEQLGDGLPDEAYDILSHMANNTMYEYKGLTKKQYRNYLKKLNKKIKSM